MKELIEQVEAKKHFGEAYQFVLGIKDESQAHSPEVFWLLVEKAKTFEEYLKCWNIAITRDFEATALKFAYGRARTEEEKARVRAMTEPGVLLEA